MVIQGYYPNDSNILASFEIFSNAESLDRPSHLRSHHVVVLFGSSIQPRGKKFSGAGAVIDRVDGNPAPRAELPLSSSPNLGRDEQVGSGTRRKATPTSSGGTVPRVGPRTYSVSMRGIPMCASLG